MKAITVSQLGFTKSDNYTRCKNSAIYSLAMREHSRKELYQKLQKKEYIEGVDVDQLLDELEEKDYLNEQRFAESFVRYRASRGQGSIKISSELYVRGIDRNLITQTLESSEINWFDLAIEQMVKKFGKSKSVDFKEKAKRMRFLFGRGFNSEIIRNIVE